MTCEIKPSKHFGRYFEVCNETHVVGVIDWIPLWGWTGKLYHRGENKAEDIGDWKSLKDAVTAMREAYFARADELGWAAGVAA